MQDPKFHDIKTISDIVNVVTPQNVECFKADFANFLTLAIAMKEAARIPSLADSILIKPFSSFPWHDDGKNDISVTFKLG